MHQYRVLKVSTWRLRKTLKLGWFSNKKEQLVSTPVAQNVIAFIFACFTSDQMQFVTVLRNNQLHFVSVTVLSSKETKNRKDSS